MADDVHVAQADDASVLDRFPMRDEDGEVRREFVGEIARAIQAADTPFLPLDLVQRLHAAAGGGDAIACSGGRDHFIAGSWPSPLKV